MRVWCALRVLSPYAPLPSSIDTLHIFVLSRYKYRCVCRPPWKKINAIRNNRGHTQRCEFSVLDRKHLCWANLAKNIKIVSLSWNLVDRPAIRICRVQWWRSLFSVFDPQISLLGKFGPKKIYQFELKLGTYTNLNMQNSMVMFTFSIIDRK